MKESYLSNAFLNLKMPAQSPNAINEHCPHAFFGGGKRFQL